MAWTILLSHKVSKLCSFDGLVALCLIINNAENFITAMRRIWIKAQTRLKAQRIKDSDKYRNSYSERNLAGVSYKKTIRLIPHELYREKIYDRQIS